MKLIDAKNMVLDLIDKDANRKGLTISIDKTSPDSDAGKFLLEGKTARVIQPFNGFNANISLNWSDGSLEQPKINRGEFYWYVFAIMETRGKKISHYFICDYLRLREWVLEFNAPLGNDHRDHNDWRGMIEINKSVTGEAGYFRWGDEPKDEHRESRIIKVNNIEELLQEEVYINLPGEIDDPSLYREGSVKTVSVDIYERDSKARRACIENYGYDCQVCGINFEEIYGEIGKGFIHVHHLVPLSDIGELYVVDPVKDLRPVCPNCHAMIHKGIPLFGISEIRKQIQ